MGADTATIPSLRQAPDVACNYKQHSVTMKILILLFTLFTFSDICKCQIPDLSNWKMDTLPIGERGNRANHSKNDWKFVLKDNKWIIIQNDYKKATGDTLPFSAEFVAKNLKEIKGYSSVKKISNGYLIGLDNGEFGGSLHFVNSSGLTEYEIAGYLNIRNIFVYKSKIFATEGLAHLGGQRGQIIEIYKQRKWKYKTFSKLIEAPRLIADYKNEKIIVTSQYILKFDSDLKVEQILKSPFYWGMLYPSSILFDNNDIYLAMRQGVLKIKSFDSSPEYEWYIPK